MENLEKLIEEKQAFDKKQRTRTAAIIAFCMLVIGVIFFVTTNTLKTNSTLKTEIVTIKDTVRELSHENSSLERTNDQFKQHTKIVDKALAKLSSNPADRNTIRQSKKVIEDLAIDTSFTITLELNANIDSAKKYEEQGFRFLLNQDVNSAINSFIKSENFYNHYHQSYEIARYLIKERKRLSTDKIELWREVYQKILDEYSWKVAISIKSELKMKLQ